MKWILLALMIGIAVANADGPDQEYINTYALIEQADTLLKNGKTDLAREQYSAAAKSLKRLQNVYPTWNQEVLKFRLDYVTQKLQSLQPAASPQTNLSAQNTNVSSAKSNPYLEELRRLQNENSKLKAELGKSQNTSGKSSTDADEIEVLRAKIAELEQERDSLKSRLDENASGKSSKKQAAQSANERDKEIQQLRARLEAIEARPQPFTTEELAMFRQTPPQLAPLEPKPAKKSRELPTGAGPLVAQAERAFAARRLDEAEQKYLDALRQDEDNVYLLGNLAATQLEMNHVDDAEKNIKKALQIESDDAYSLTLLGIIKFRQDKFDEALDLLSRAAAINPQNAETQNYLGITLSQKGQRAAAEAALRKAVQLQPNYAGAHHNLAVIYATQRPPFLQLARWHYERALSLGHPKNPELEKILSETK